MDILKDLVSSVHDIGGPEKAQNNIVYTGKIDTSKIGFLDFNLSEEENCICIIPVKRQLKKF